MKQKQQRPQQWQGHYIIGAGGKAVPIAIVPGEVDATKATQIYNYALQGKHYPKSRRCSSRRAKIADKKYAALSQNHSSRRPTSLKTIQQYASHLSVPYDVIGACQRFHNLFGFWPRRIGVSSLRPRKAWDLGIRMLEHQPTHSLFGTATATVTSSWIKAIDIPFESCDGLGWDDFTLNSEQFGSLTSADLEMSEMTLKRMIEAKGYPVQISHFVEYHYGYLSYLIRKGNQAMRWVVAPELLEKPFYIIQEEINYQLRQFSSDGFISD